MNGWSKEELEEMCGDDIVEQLAFLSGCFKHKLSNDVVVPDGWIIPDELLRKFALLIVKECANKLATRASYYTSCSSDDPTTADWFSGTANGLEEGIELIQQHFGVK